jgi:hypothetical protein
MEVNQMSNVPEIADDDPALLDLLRRTEEFGRKWRAEKLAASLPPTVTQRAADRFDESKKPTEALLQDVTATANAVTRRMGEAEWLEQERLKRAAEIRAWEDEQHKWATDGAASRNYDAAYRRAVAAQGSDQVAWYNAACEAEVATRNAAAAIRNARISFHKSPLDPDF